MNKLFSFALMAVFFASCQSAAENEPADVPSESTEMTTAPAPAAAEPVTLNPVGDAAALPAATTPPAGNDQRTAALNPEHGQPGHRCDIPVGAPLNSPAGASPAASPILDAIPPASAAPVTAQPATGSGQRLNPPHGQPGHDCAVAVGAPLNG